MKHKLVITRDGSHSIEIPEMNVAYHSVHGAIQESMHVFINAGLLHFTHHHPHNPISILEIGFGTGLNILLTARHALLSNLSVSYSTIEPFPISHEIAEQLNYSELLKQPALAPVLQHIHSDIWETPFELVSGFDLYKIKTDLLSAEFPNESYDLIYFDAFAPTAQPELWTAGAFKKLLLTLRPGGTLVTYCSKSIIRKAMMEAGFEVKKIQGPWGKREMVRASRKISADSKS